MLSNFLPLIITGLSIMLAIGFHYLDKKRFLLPCAFAALGTSVFAYFGFSYLLSGQELESAEFPWNGVRFAFISGFVVAMFVGYLIKHVPKFFIKK